MLMLISRSYAVVERPLRGHRGRNRARGGCTINILNLYIVPLPQGRLLHLDDADLDETETSQIVLISSGDLAPVVAALQDIGFAAFGPQEQRYQEAANSAVR